MKKGYVGLLACASGILIGLGISRLDLTGYLEKTQEQESPLASRMRPQTLEECRTAAYHRERQAFVSCDQGG